MCNGFIRLFHEDVRNDWIYKGRTLPVLVYLYDRANFAQRPATIATTWAQIARETRSTLKEVRTALKRLTGNGYISYQSRPRHGITVAILCTEGRTTGAAEKGAQEGRTRAQEGRTNEPPKNLAIVRKIDAPESSEGRTDEKKGAQKGAPDTAKRAHQTSPKNLDSTRRCEPSENQEGRTERGKKGARKGAVIEEDIEEGVCVGADTHTDFEPPTEEAAIRAAQDYAERRGFAALDAEASARAYWLYYQSTGWKTQRGAPIIDRSAALALWIEDDEQNRRHRRTTTGKGLLLA